MIRHVSWLIALLICLPVTAGAQQGVSLRIDEFDGFPWGTTEEVIIDRLGEPVQADTLAENVVVLGFLGTIVDTASVAMFAFLPGEGLVKGQHSITFDASSEACVALFRTMRNHLLLKYPMIVPVDRSRNDSGKGFCSAVVDGDAAWLATWEDPETGAQATVSIEAGRPRLNVVFESARFIAWVNDREPASVPEL
jgi:hypothetical protein